MTERIQDALVHLDAALAELVLEAYRGTSLDNMVAVDHFTIAEELKRIDSALGPKGESMFARMADNIVAAYTEILAAKAALSPSSPEGERN